MGIPVLILGESGSGKSASMRNFTPEEVSVFNVASKPFPFRKKLPSMQQASYQSIKSALSKPNKKAYVIDDSQYLMAFEFFNRANENGFNKFTEIGLHFKDIIDFIINNTPPDCIVYFLHHVELDGNNRLKAKTIGKMLDEKLTVEGMFSIVLLCEAGQTGHHFITQSGGFCTAKTPMEMFPPEIDNDLKLVDASIREYYGMN